MKKAEFITLVCGLAFIVLVVGYLKFSSRLAKAENEARRANELIAELQQSGSDGSSAVLDSTIPPVAAVPDQEPSLPIMEPTTHSEVPQAPQLKLVATSPWTDKAYLEGLEAQKRKDFEAALRLFQDVASRFPPSEDLVEKVGSSYIDLERLDDAIRHYKDGLRLFPDSAAQLFICKSFQDGFGG